MLPTPFRFAVVLRETLEARGALLPVKARIRAEIFKALDDQVIWYFIHHTQMQGSQWKQQQ